MVSSKDIEETKKVCAGIRQMNKEVLDHLYAQAAETGRYLTPDKAIYQLYQLLKVVVIGNQPPMTLAEFQRIIMRKQDAIDLEAWLGSRLFRDTYHDAVDAYFRHRPGLEIKKGKRGRRPNVELIEHVLTLHASKSYREIAKVGLRTVPEGKEKNLRIEKERERIRAVVRRDRRRKSNT